MIFDDTGASSLGTWLLEAVGCVVDELPAARCSREDLRTAPVCLGFLFGIVVLSLDLMEIESMLSKGERMQKSAYFTV